MKKTPCSLRSSSSVCISLSVDSLLMYLFLGLMHSSQSTERGKLSFVRYHSKLGLQILIYGRKLKFHSFTGLQMEAWALKET